MFAGVYVSCEICHVRKEKRFCPAIHGRICAQCCGEQREITLDCPDPCPYLQQARLNHKGRAPEELTGEELFRDIDLDQRFYYERQPLITGLLFTLARLGSSHRDWHDHDVIGALTALAKYYRRTTGSGIIYDDFAPNLIHRSVAAELRKMIAEYQQVEEQNLGRLVLKETDILKALVFLVRTAHARTSGRPRSRAFLAALAAQFPASAGEVSSGGSSSSIIVP